MVSKYFKIEELILQEKFIKNMEKEVGKLSHIEHL